MRIGNTLVKLKGELWAYLETEKVHLPSKLSVTYGGSVNHYKREEGFFWTVQEGGLIYEITPKSTWLL